MLLIFFHGLKLSLIKAVFTASGAVFTKGLGQVSDLSWLYFCTKVKPKTWLRPFVNTAPGHYVAADITWPPSSYFERLIKLQNSPPGNSSLRRCLLLLGITWPWT